MYEAAVTDIEKAFDEGEILRTHVMRPTWHFVAPQDIRELLALTAPRVHAVNAQMSPKTGIERRLLVPLPRRIEKGVTRQ